MGLVGGMSITDNMLLKTYGDQHGPFLAPQACQGAGGKARSDGCRSARPASSIAVQKLSGGNVQKVLLGP